MFLVYVCNLALLAALLLLLLLNDVVITDFCVLDLAASLFTSETKGSLWTIDVVVMMDFHFWVSCLFK